MTNDTIPKLNIQNLKRHTAKVLQLEYTFIVYPKGLLKNIMVSIRSCQYHAGCIVFHTKAKLSGYSIILGSPYLAIKDAHISYR